MKGESGKIGKGREKRKEREELIGGGQHGKVFFPQDIDVELGLSSGIYGQRTVGWTEMRKNMKRSFGGAYRDEPGPQILVTVRRGQSATPAGRAMQQR